MQLDECFLFHVIAGRRIFSQNLSLLWDFFNPHIVIFFETSVLKEVRILRYHHNNSVVLILMLMLSSKKSYPILYLYILEKLSYVAGFFMITFYTLFIFLNVQTTLYRAFFLFLKNSKHIWKHVFTYCKTFLNSFFICKSWVFLYKVRTKLRIKITWHDDANFNILIQRKHRKTKKD